MLPAVFIPQYHPRGKKPQITEKAPAQIATMWETQPKLTSHYDTVVENILEKSRCKKVFLRLGIGTNIIQRLSFIAAFTFLCLAFHTKHSKYEKSYKWVTTSSTSWEQRGQKGKSLFSADTTEWVPSVDGSLWICNPAPLSASQSQAGHLTVGGSPPGPLFCPASQAG